SIATWQSIEKTRAFTRAVAAEKVAKTEAGNNREVSQFLKGMLKGLGPSVSVARDTGVLRDILDKTAESTARDLTNQPLVALELRTTIAGTYGDLGLVSQMEEMARQNLKLARSLLGDQNTAAGEALYQISEAGTHRGKLGEAETSIRQALQIYKNLYGN